MMNLATYNSIIGRTGADVLVPQPVANEIFQGITEESAVLRLARRLPNMTSKTLKLPVLNSLPYAYFVDGDTGLKQTTQVDWRGKVITAEEIAVIVPVPDAVLADSDFDIWGQIRPLVTQAFGQVIDRAMLYGVNKPASWPDGIVQEANSKSRVIVLGDDPYDDIMAAGGVISLVETSGYNVTGYVGAVQARGILRGIKDTTGQPIFRNGMTGGTSYMLDGQPIMFPMNGSIDPTETLLIAGDFRQMVYAIRQDLTVTRSNEAVITDAAGKVIYNLYQQDMTALRFVMRLGWQLPNPLNNIGGEDRYPFAILAPDTASSLTKIGSAAYTVTAPVKSATPQATHNGGTGYTAAITWEPTAETFAASTAYTAKVTYSATSGYAFPADFGAANVTGLPTTSGGGATATSVNVMRESASKVTATVAYKATGA